MAFWRVFKSTNKKFWFKLLNPGNLQYENSRTSVYAEILILVELWPLFVCFKYTNLIDKHMSVCGGGGGTMFHRHAVEKKSVNIQGSHRLEKYLNTQDCLEKSLKIKFALKKSS